MLYHTSLCVPDVLRAGEFYDRLLAPMGMTRIWKLEPLAIGYGRKRGEFWLQAPEHMPFLSVTKHGHFAFACETKEQVTEVHDAGIAAGGRSMAPPAADPAFGPDYFFAIVEDLDGHMVEIMRWPADQR
jgi:catechol 2,3-dioxygenase-like lactoylglutathione lyase family enzyme